jgi:hypothetical protein
MCDRENQQVPDKSEMVQVDQRPAKNTSSGTTQNRLNRDSSTQQRNHHQQRNPYRAADFLSNVTNFKIIESTLRGTPISPYPALRNFY